MSAVAGTAAARSAPAPRPVRPSFAGAARSELVKIRTQALTWVLVAGFAVICGIVMGSLVSSDMARMQLARDPEAFYLFYLASVLTLFNFGSGVFLLVLSARLVSMEYGSGTIRIVLARGTGRLELLGAQFAALAVSGLLLLMGFMAVCTAALYSIVVAWQGSFAPITSLPGTAWTDTAVNLLVALVSMAVCILLGSAAAVVGRSVAFAMGVALSFFPADNFGTVVMMLAARLTHQDLWPQLTQYFLGPVLNQLPVSLQTDRKLGP